MSAILYHKDFVTVKFTFPPKTLSFTYSVNVSLVEEDEEYNVVPKATDPVHRRHLDDKGKYVIDEGVQSLVCHHTPREVRHRFEFVVDKKLRRHHDES